MDTVADAPSPAPDWLRPVAVVALAWYVFGTFVIIGSHFADPLTLSPVQRAFTGYMPWWAHGAIQLAVVTGIGGSIALLFRHRWALPLMVGTLIDLAALHPVAQDDLEATYAPKIDKAESRIDFHRDAEFIERQVRAFAPAPGAFFEIGQERYRVLHAEVIGREGAPGTVLDDRLTVACGHGAIRPTLIQRAGKPAMDAAALLRGHAIPAGTVLR